VPKTNSAKKRLRSSHKRFLRNRALRSRMKTAIKKAKATIEVGNLEESRVVCDYTFSVIDRALKKGAIHNNKASREKSKIGKKLSTLLKVDK